MRKPITVASLLLATLVLAGCQTTALQSAWYDPTFTGGPMHRITVVAAGLNVANRRLAEDIFSERLRALGVHAAPGWAVVSDEERNAAEPFTQALRRSGAQGVLVIRVLGVDTQTQVATMMVTTSVSTWGGPTWGSPNVWATTTVPVVVSQYALVVVETSLYEVATGRLVWSGITQTLNPSNFQSDVRGFANVIIGQLVARRLLGTAG
ncbi:MAG: hypothetical protein WB493_12085 [Anaeromyxobacteraceae bacterium]